MSVGHCPPERCFCNSVCPCLCFHPSRPSPTTSLLFSFCFSFPPVRVNVVQFSLIHLLHSPPSPSSLTLFLQLASIPLLLHSIALSFSISCLFAPIQPSHRWRNRNRDRAIELANKPPSLSSSIPFSFTPFSPLSRHCHPCLNPSRFDPLLTPDPIRPFHWALCLNQLLRSPTHRFCPLSFLF